MIVKLSMGSLCHISNVIVDSELQQEDIDGYLKEGIALDEECMKRILTKKFAKAASILNTPEYTALIQIRRENPDFTIELREIKKKEGKKSYRNLTYEHMEAYIITRDGKGSEAHKEFEQVKKLSQVQAGPYAYVKSWFLKKYKDEFQQEEETTEAPAKQLDLKLVSNN